MILIKSLFFFISLLLMIAFFTLWERKILGYIQLRKGPNLVGVMGILQPFADGLKLFLKKMSPLNFFFIPVSIFPMFFFLGSLLIWLPLFHINMSSPNNFMVIICISSLMAILTFFCGWGSNSKFALMGGIRASAQMISYEVVFSFSFLVFLSGGLSFTMGEQLNLWNGEFFFLWSMIPLIFIIILAETNRTPFDLVEGESELVSGFNTEFSSVSFVLLFLGEYSFICFFSSCLALLLFKTMLLSSVFLFLFVWVRASFPRKRYDSLMLMMWIWYFPLVTTFLCFIFFYLFV